MIRKYKHLFFDIDRTLWDYETNAAEILNELFYKYSLNETSINVDDFVKEFNRCNDLMWKKYNRGMIKKETLRDRRFYMTLRKFKIKDKNLALKLSKEYIEKSPDKTNLFPEVTETLEYLKKHYRLHIITNGFDEVQFKKLKNCGIKDFFEKVVTSDNAGYTKPDVRIFQYAITSVNAKKTESLMIGDNWEIDILGAKAYGIDQVYFNPVRKKHKDKATFEITGIGELKGIL